MLQFPKAKALRKSRIWHSGHRKAGVIGSRTTLMLIPKPPNPHLHRRTQGEVISDVPFAYYGDIPVEEGSVQLQLKQVYGLR